MSSAWQGPGVAPVRQVGRSFRTLTIRTSRVMLLWGAVSFALVGALTTPPYVVLVLAPACGLFVGSLVAFVNPAFPKARSARRAAILSGMGGTLFVPCLAGLGQFGFAGAVAAVVLIALALLLASAWFIEHCDPLDRGGVESEVDVEDLQQFLRALPTSMLLREWRSTGEHLQPGTDPARRAHAVLVRNLLLEELSRRDPVGVARWLSEGDEDAPEQYLRGDSDATT